GHQRRRPRIHGDRLRVCLVHGQQRPEHGGAECQQRLLQHHDHTGHAGWAIRARGPCAGTGRPFRASGPQSGNHRHAAQRYYHVWNPGAGDGPAHRCSILSPGSRPGADRGIPEDGGRWLILSPTFAEAQFAFFALIFLSGQAGFSTVLTASAISGSSPHKQVRRSSWPLRAAFSSPVLLTSASPILLVFGLFPPDRLPLPWDQTAPRTSHGG